MSNEYCIYLRKSRADDPNASIEETLARHEKILLETAKKMKLSIVKIYREVVSGETISDRPQMQLLLNAVDQGLYAGVLVVEIERLARGNSIDQGIIAQSFQLSDTKIITPSKVIDPNNEFDSESLEFGLFMSRREYKTINRRLQRGRIESVKEGKYLGTKPPYGYTRKKLENQKGYTLDINSEQADIVKLVYELYTKGEHQPDGSYNRMGVSLIVRKLNELRIPPMRGDVWAPSTIQDMLRNPVYIGKIRWNSRPVTKKMVDGQMIKERPRANKEDWILVDGLHEAIISKETFELAQNYMSSNPSVPVPTKHVVKNPLAGLIICGMCGRRMNRRPYKSDYPDTLMCPSTACNNISSHLYLVENNLIKALESWLESYKIDLVSSESYEPNSDLQTEIKKKAISKLETEIETLEKQLDNLHNLLEQGVYSIDKFVERSKIISEKIKVLNDDKNTLLEILKQDNAKDKSKKMIVPKVEKVIKIYGELESPSDKNELLKEVIEKVIYTKTVSGRWEGKPDDFQLDLYPKIYN